MPITTNSYRGQPCNQRNSNQKRWLCPTRLARWTVRNYFFTQTFAAGFFWLEQYRNTNMDPVWAILSMNAFLPSIKTDYFWTQASKLSDCCFTTYHAPLHSLLPLRLVGLGGGSQFEISHMYWSHQLISSVWSYLVCNEVGPQESRGEYCIVQGQHCGDHCGDHCLYSASSAGKEEWKN